MTKDKLIYFGLLIGISCSTVNNEKKIEGHWHCVKSGECEFETIDIKDSVIIADKFIIESYSQVLHIGQDVNAQIDRRDRLSLNYIDTSFYYFRSDLNKCLISDRYKDCMIDLSLPEVRSALSFDISITKYTTGDLYIGKLKQGYSNSNDQLVKQYPDSIFIQVNDVLIGFKDIPGYIQFLGAGLHRPRENINLHVDRDVPEGFVGELVKLINPDNYHSTMIHNVVKIKNGDIGLLKR
ncbi:MAG: hypothetical protein KIT51_04830 [Cyclobacteriaceae bacterium]|nr:MAG: hypothetical protein KIT51_04830 [Cyclobacteriaceae bacterium]